MSDRTAEAIFGEIFELIADDHEAAPNKLVTEYREHIAKKIYDMSKDYDFGESNLPEEALSRLGIKLGEKK